jgi:hypothetical protein
MGIVFPGQSSGNPVVILDMKTRSKPTAGDLAVDDHNIHDLPFDSLCASASIRLC